MVGLTMLPHVPGWQDERKAKWEEQIRNGGRLAALSLGRETDTPTPYLRT